MKIALILIGLLCLVVLFFFLRGEMRERRTRYTRLLHTTLQNLTIQQDFPLGRTCYILGRRKRKCDIVIGGEDENARGYDKTISKVHAVLRFDGTRWVIFPAWSERDPGYTTLFVNDRQIGPEGTVLRPVQDIVVMGQHTLRLIDTAAQ